MYNIFVLLAVAVERAITFGGRLPFFARVLDRVRHVRFERGIRAIPFACYPIALVALSLGFSALVDHAHARAGSTSVAVGLPYDFLYLRDMPWHREYAVVGPVLLADVVLQSIVLGMLYVRLRTRAPSRTEIAVGCLGVLAFIVAALRRNLLESTDMYNYIVYAKVGMAGAYRMPIAIDDPALRRVATLTWGSLPPSPYGPLWQLYDRAIVNVPSLVDAALRLRIFNTAVLLGLFGGLFAARTPIAAIAILALNPYLYQEFVVDAHNDLLPIVALTLGSAFAYRSRWFAIVATAAAGLVKLPLLIVGIATLGAIRSVGKRLAIAAAIVAFDLAISVVIGGQPYVSALLVAADPTGTDALVHAILVVLGLSAVALVFFTRRRYWPGLLAIPALRSFGYPWYLIWLLPIAYGGKRPGFPIAIVFPTIGLLLSDVYFTSRKIGLVLYVGVALAVAAMTSLDRRRARSDDVGGAQVARATV